MTLELSKTLTTQEIVTSYLKYNKSLKESAKDLGFKSGATLKYQLEKRANDENFESMEEMVQHYCWFDETKFRRKPLVDKTDDYLGKTIILIGCQNNVLINDHIWNNLMGYAKEERATVLCTTLHYNANGGMGALKRGKFKKDEKVFWDPRVEPYIIDQPIQVAKNLILANDINTPASMINPLAGNGWAGLYGRNSIIVPSTRNHMRAIPCATGKNGTKHLYCSQVITEAKYPALLAGQKAQTYHSVGCVVINISKSGKWHLRQLEFGEDYSLYDITKKGIVKVEDGVPTYGHRASLLHPGDLHLEFCSKDALKTLFFGKKSLMALTQPENLIIHDGVDSYAINHHHKGDKFMEAEKYFQNKTDYSKEIRDFCLFIDKALETGYVDKVEVVDSNHDRQIKGFMNSNSYANDFENAILWHKLNLAMLEQRRDGDIEHTCDFNMYQFLYEEIGSNGKDKVRFMMPTDDLVINDTECKLHGDRGANGARGSHNAFRKMGMKVNVGHSHTAGITDNVFQAGVTADKDMRYNALGISSWSNSHIIGFPNGKRCMVTVFDGEFLA